MNYYKIDPDIFSEKWAYGEVYSKCIKYDHTIKPITCPLCGRDIEGSKWLGTYDIIVNKKKLGDIIYGIPNLFLVSERFVSACRKFNIKGFSNFIEVNLYYRSEKLDDRYFQTEINYSMKKVDFAKEQNRKRVTNKSLPKCSLCMKSGNGDLDNWKKIYFNEDLEFDIFKIYEKRGELYCNQNFVDFCRNNDITNIGNYFKEIY